MTIRGRSQLLRTAEAAIMIRTEPTIAGHRQPGQAPGRRDRPQDPDTAGTRDQLLANVLAAVRRAAHRDLMLAFSHPLPTRRRDLRLAGSSQYLPNDNRTAGPPGASTEVLPVVLLAHKLLPAPVDRTPVPLRRRQTRKGADDPRDDHRGGRVRPPRGLSWLSPPKMFAQEDQQRRGRARAAGARQARAVQHGHHDRGHDPRTRGRRR